MRVVDNATYCSSCYGQHEDRQYVDFDAAWDGPVLEIGDENQHLVHNIDDLIICDRCLEAASTLVGMVHNKRMIQENYELGKAIEEKDAYITSLEKIVSDLDHTVGAVLTQNVKRGKGRPNLRLPDSDTAPAGA